MVHFEPVGLSDARVDVGHGVSVPEMWSVRVTGEQGVPGRIQVDALYVPELGRAVAECVIVLRGDGRDEVTSLTLREVRVQNALQVSGLKVSTVSEPGHPISTGGEYIRRMRERTDRSLAESVTDASRVYHLAAVINLPPLRTVADSLGVSQSTATRLMSRARSEGLAPGARLPDQSLTGPIVGPPSSGGPSLS